MVGRVGGGNYLSIIYSSLFMGLPGGILIRGKFEKSVTHKYVITLFLVFMENKNEFRSKERSKGRERKRKRKRGEILVGKE